MIIAHKIALDPNDRQATYFAKAAGVARFAYNWALAEWKRQYKARLEDPSLPAPSEAALRKLLNSVKAEQFPWMAEVIKNAPQQAIKNLGAAFNRFFTGQAKYPRFKKKGEYDSFRADPGPDKNHPHAVDVSGKRVKLPVIGWVRMRELLRFRGKVLSAVAIATADWPTPTRRPPNSRLDCAKLARVFGVSLPDWHDATQRVIASMFTANHAS